MSEFRVELKRVVDDSYSIAIGDTMQEELLRDLSNGLVGKRRLVLITDSNVEPLYALPLCEKLRQAGFAADVLTIPAGETSKTRETKASLEDQMLALDCRRDCAVLAVGGGVVTDLAGFTAGTFARGVPFINYATTLLAAADASIGGKTAVDTPLATNLIGLFNQPKKVYIDLAAWKTLPRRQVSCGLAETIKHACLADGAFFDWLEENLDGIFAMEPAVLRHMAETNCRIKYSVVMRDERENGLREVLNLGHTVGRAIETVSGYALLHGEAVSIGLAAQVRLAAARGYVTNAEAARVEALLQRASLPVRIPETIDREALVKKLYTDKKVREGKLRFVLQKGIGNVVEFAPGVFSTPVPEAEIAAILREM